MPEPPNPSLYQQVEELRQKQRQFRAIVVTEIKDLKYRADQLVRNQDAIAQNDGKRFNRHVLWLRLLALLMILNLILTVFWRH